MTEPMTPKQAMAYRAPELATGDSSHSIESTNYTLPRFTEADLRRAREEASLTGELEGKRRAYLVCSERVKGTDETASQDCALASEAAERGNMCVLQKVREEATVAAAGAMRERVAAITDGHLDVTEALGIHRLSAYIRNALLVTSPEGEKWLREHDAGVRAEAYSDALRLCATRITLNADIANDVAAKESAYLHELAAQSTGTPE